MLDRERFYAEAAAAQFLNVSRRTLQRMRQEGWGPAYTRVGKRLIGYSEAALSEYAKSRTYAHRAGELAGCAFVQK